MKKHLIDFARNPMKASTLVYLISNLVGGFLFLLFTNRIYGNMQAEGRDYSDFGDGLNFFLTAVPVFLLCLIYNFVWAIKSAFDVYRRQNYEGRIALVTVVGSWTVLIIALRLTH